MTVPQSSKYLIASGSTDWLPKLTEYYTKRAQQEEKSLAEWQAHRAEKVRVSAEEDPIKALEKFAGVVNKVGTIVQAHKKAEAKKELEETTEYKNKWLHRSWFVEGQDDLAAAAETLWNTKENSVRENPKLTDRLKEIRKQNPAEFNELLNLTGREQIAVRKLMARTIHNSSSVEGMIAEWTAINPDTKLPVDPNGYANITKWNDYKDNANGRRGMYQAYLLNRLAPLQLDDEFELAVIGREINKKTGTVANLTLARSYAEASSAKTRKDYEKLLSVGNDVTAFSKELTSLWEDTLKYGQFEDITLPDGSILKKERQATNHVKSQLASLLLDEKIPKATLAYYEAHGIPHPAAPDGKGTVGGHLLTPQDVKDLVEAADLGEERFLGRQTVQDEQNYAKAFLLKQRGNTVEADKIIAGIRSRGLVSEEKIRNYDRVTAESMTAPALAQEEVNYQDMLRAGTLGDNIAELEASPQTPVRDKYLNIAKRIKKYTDENKFSTQLDSIRNEVTSTRVGSTTFDKNKTVTSEKDKVIADDIAAFKKQAMTKLVLAQYNDQGVYTENPNISIDIANAVETYKTNNGWGTTDQKGKFSIVDDKRGNRTWGNYFNELKEFKGNYYDHSISNIDTRGTDYDNKLNNYESREQRHNSVEGIFNRNQIKAVLDGLGVNQDMWYNVSREGESFGELWPKTINALINSDDTRDVAIVQRYNLKEKDFTPIQSDLIMAKRLIQTAEANKGTSKGRLAKDLQAIQRWYGIEFFAHNPNLMRRLYELIGETNTIDQLTKVDAALDQKALEDK